MRNRGITALVMLALVAMQADRIAAQETPALSFDAVSIKPNTSGEFGGTSRTQPGRYQGVNVTLIRLISLAYRPVQDFEGGPEWIKTERFDVDARAEGTPNQEQMLRMLRAMLIDRFKLAVRTDVRQRPVYALTLARRDRTPGPQLRPSDAPCPGGPGTCGVRVESGVLTSKGITLARLASELSFVGRHVIDRTDLPGAFEVDLKWTPEAGGAAPTSPDDLPSIFTAIQEQLGLKLEPATGPVEVLVIERAEKPSAN